MGDNVILIKIFIKLSLDCVDILGRKSDVGHTWSLIHVSFIHGKKKFVSPAPYQKNIIISGILDL